MKRPGISRKKALKHPNADAIKRKHFCKSIKAYEDYGMPVIYLDESGFANDIPRTHGYTLKGNRYYGVHNWHSKGRVNAIVMDNATFHKRVDMIAAIKEAGYTPEYLPPYSPDLNPIEQKWAQAKAARKKYRCDVYELFSTYLEYDLL